MAASKIEKATQDSTNSWVVSFREKAETNPPMLRIHLHGSLLNAADSLRGEDPDLAKELKKLCQLLDSLLPE